MHGPAPNHKPRAREVRRRADVVPVHVAQHHDVHIFRLESSPPQTLGRIWKHGCGLALCDVVLLGRAVAAEVALETEVEDEGGWLRRGRGVLDEEGEGGDCGTFGGVGVGDEEEFREGEGAGIEGGDCDADLRGGGGWEDDWRFG
jgi:hypothetical protein